MPDVFAAEAGDHLCPYNDFTPCFGEKCMAWMWLGPRADRCETDNLVLTEEGERPVGAPAAPEGVGWEMDGPSFPKGYHQSAKLNLPKATGQRWIKQRQKVSGHCGRVPGGGYDLPW